MFELPTVRRRNLFLSLAWLLFVSRADADEARLFIEIPQDRVQRTPALYTQQMSPFEGDTAIDSVVYRWHGPPDARAVVVFTEISPRLSAALYRLVISDLQSSLRDRDVAIVFLPNAGTYLSALEACAAKTSPGIDFGMSVYGSQWFKVNGQALQITPTHDIHRYGDGFAPLMEQPAFLDCAEAVDRQLSAIPFPSNARGIINPIFDQLRSQMRDFIPQMLSVPVYVGRVTAETPQGARRVRLHHVGSGAQIYDDASTLSRVRDDRSDDDEFPMPADITTEIINALVRRQLLERELD